MGIVRLAKVRFDKNNMSFLLFSNALTKPEINFLIFSDLPDFSGYLLNPSWSGYYSGSENLLILNKSKEFLV